MSWSSESEWYKISYQKVGVFLLLFCFCFFAFYVLFVCFFFSFFGVGGGWEAQSVIWHHAMTIYMIGHLHTSTGANQNESFIKVTNLCPFYSLKIIGLFHEYDEHVLVLWLSTFISYDKDVYVCVRIVQGTDGSWVLYHTRRMETVSVK